MRNEYSLFTPCIESAAAAVGAWIDQRAKGGVIYGPSQFGKTNGLSHWLEPVLAERLGGPVPFMFWSYEPSNTAAQFYAKLLRMTRGGSRARSRRDPLVDLVEFIISLAYSTKARYTLLVLDEAQGMTEREWIWLVQLHATVEHEGGQLCVVPVISLQFNQRPLELAYTGSAHASARFMLYEYPFHGMRSAEELRHVMLGYDEDSEWPPGSGLSYTAGLIPIAFEAGFRANEFAPQLWTALHDGLPTDYGGPSDFPMQSVALATRIVLMRVAAAGSNWEACVSLDAWREAVNMTGHRAHMALVNFYGGARRKRNGES